MSNEGIRGDGVYRFCRGLEGLKSRWDLSSYRLGDIGYPGGEGGYPTDMLDLVGTAAMAAWEPTAIFVRAREEMKQKAGRVKIDYWPAAGEYRAQLIEAGIDDKDWEMIVRLRGQFVKNDQKQGLGRSWKLVLGGEGKPMEIRWCGDTGFMDIVEIEEGEGVGGVNFTFDVNGKLVDWEAWSDREENGYYISSILNQVRLRFLKRQTRVEEWHDDQVETDELKSFFPPQAGLRQYQIGDGQWLIWGEN